MIRHPLNARSAAPIRLGVARSCRRSGGARDAGFALIFVVVTMALVLTLMLALLGVTVGATRSSTSARQRAAAQANAETALRVAMGELQRTAGPDRAGTATSGIMGDKVKQRHLTGVWRSWKIEPARPPAAADYEKSKKAERFLGWLISHPDRQATRDQNFAANADLPADRRVTLLGTGTLGQAAPEERVEAARVNVPSGSAAWAVLDEGVKARVDIGYDEKADSPGMRAATLGTGRQPALWFLPGLEKIPPKSFDVGSAEAKAALGKWLTPSLADLGLRALGGEPTGSLLNHHLTTDSVGLMIDVVDGELRKDLSLLSNQSPLPARYTGAGVYEATLGLKGLPSDPRWEQILGYERL